MIAALQGFLFLVSGYVLIFAGMAFSNKQLLPSFLGDIYDGTNYTVRVLVFTALFALPANFLIPKAFQVSSASVAGPLSSLAMLFCCLTAWLLEAQRLSS